MRCASVAASGRRGKASRTGRAVDAVIVRSNAPSHGASVPINSAAERPIGVSDICRNAERRVSVVTGDAQLKIAKVSGPFDLIFQDGDKKLYTPLLDRLVGLLRPGGLLITDNVLWDGEVVPGFQQAPRQRPDDTRAIIEYNQRLAAHPQLVTSIVPLRDGVSISVKRPG